MTNTSGMMTIVTGSKNSIVQLSIVKNEETVHIAGCNHLINNKNNRLKSNTHIGDLVDIRASHEGYVVFYFQETICKMERERSGDFPSFNGQITVLKLTIFALRNGS